MKIALLLLLLGLGAVSVSMVSRPRTDRVEGASGGDGSPQRTPKQAALREVEALIANWPQPAQRAARRTIHKYGVPDHATGRQLVWNDNGPWKRTIVRRDADAAPLENVAPYRVPHDRYQVLSDIPGHVSGERGEEELSARSELEPLNMLSLNLADEVIWRKRTVDEARRFHENAAALALSGKSSPYTEKLLFIQE